MNSKNVMLQKRNRATSTLKGFMFCFAKENSCTRHKPPTHSLFSQDGCLDSCGTPVILLIIVLLATELHDTKHTQLCQHALILGHKLLGLSSNQKARERMKIYLLDTLWLIVKRPRNTSLINSLCKEYMFLKHTCQCPVLTMNEWITLLWYMRWWQKGIIRRMS